MVKITPKTKKVVVRTKPSGLAWLTGVPHRFSGSTKDDVKAHRTVHPPRKVNGKTISSEELSYAIYHLFVYKNLGVDDFLSARKEIDQETSSPSGQLTLSDNKSVKFDTRIEVSRDAWSNKVKHDSSQPYTTNNEAPFSLDPKQNPQLRRPYDKEGGGYWLSFVKSGKYFLKVGTSLSDQTTLSNKDHQDSIPTPDRRGIAIHPGGPNRSIGCITLATVDFDGNHADGKNPPHLGDLEKQFLEASNDLKNGWVFEDGKKKRRVFATPFVIERRANFFDKEHGCWRAPPNNLKIRLLDMFERPLSKANYKLEIGELKFEGSTNESGELSHQVLAHSGDGVLTLDNWSLKLKIGTLDSSSTVAGARARLANLGYMPGQPQAPESEASDSAEPSDTADESFKESLSRFQTAHGIESDGELNDTTSKKLDKIYSG